MNREAKPMLGTGFCPGCGTETMPLAEVCVKCGVRIAREPAGGISPKSRLVASLLAFFLGILGVHRFYVGRNETASVMLSFGIIGLIILGLAAILSLNDGLLFWGLSFAAASGIWAFVDFVLAVTGHMKDGEGRLIKEWRLVAPARKPEYYYIKYAVSVLRVLGWVVLIIGILASILLGLEIMNGGLVVGTRELIGARVGASAIVLGIVGSFLAWLILLAARELICLFTYVEEGTRSTTEGIIDKSS
jgi:TM2 domain-containing membrane protein YozV